FRRAAGAPYGEEAVHSVNTAVADGLKRVLRAFSDQESLAHTAARKSGGERRKGMKSRKWMFIALFAALTITVQLSAHYNPDHHPTFTSFDAPGAATGNGFGTVALSINPAGAIMGYYNDANAVFHGFLRARDATIATFDPPGSAFTIPGSINPAGTIAGFYFDVDFVPHGFLRARDGTFTTFDLPVGSSVFTSTPPSINPEGAITGYYLDASNVLDGFLR